MQTKINLRSKTSFFLAVICLFSHSSFSQAKEKFISKIYLQAEGGTATRSGLPVGFGLQAISKNNWTATISYHSINMEPKNIPADFNAGTTIILFIPIPQKQPSIDLKLLSFNMGRNYGVGKNTWITTEAGLSFVSGKKIDFSKNPNNQSTWLLIAGEIPSNYTYNEEKKKAIGAMLKADFNWAFASFAGLGAGVFTNINSIQSPLGFQFKLLFGNVGRSRKF